MLLHCVTALIETMQAKTGWRVRAGVGWSHPSELGLSLSPVRYDTCITALLFKSLTCFTWIRSVQWILFFWCIVSFFDLLDIFFFIWWPVPFIEDVLVCNQFCYRVTQCLNSGLSVHEIHETCHSVTFYFMSELIF